MKLLAYVMALKNKFTTYILSKEHTVTLQLLKCYKYSHILKKKTRKKLYKDA